MGAAHPKRWSKSSFSALKKAVKTQKATIFGAKFEILFSRFLIEVCFCFSHKIEKK